MEQKRRNWANAHSQLWTSPQESPHDSFTRSISEDEKHGSGLPSNTNVSERNRASKESTRDIRHWASIVDEVLFRLCGTRNIALKDGNPDASSLEDGLYRVCFEIEKCDEIIHSMTENAKIATEGASLKDLLVEICKSATASRQGTEPAAESRLTSRNTLWQVADILEGYGKITAEADIPSVLLSLVKELEKQKRQASFNTLLLDQYESTVREAFALYGEPSPPLVAEAQQKLLGEGNVTEPHPAAWIEGALEKLYYTIENMSILHEDALWKSQLPLPFCVRGDAQLTKDNISTILERASSCLASISEECCRAKEELCKREPSVQIIAPSTEDVDNNDAAHTEGRSAKAPILPARELKAVAQCLPPSVQRQYHLDEGDYLLHTLDAEYGARLACAVKAVLSIPAPASAASDAAAGAPAVSSRRSSHGESSAAPRDAKENSLFTINSMNRLLNRVFLGKEDICEDDDMVGHSIPEALALLEQTVVAVAEFPKDAQVRVNALRCEVEDAIVELAQLLPVDTSLAFEKGIRVEPPTSDLMQMTHILRARFTEWALRRQKQFLSGAQGRASKARLEEVVKTYGSQMMQILKEMTTTNDGDEEEDGHDGEVAAALLEEAAAENPTVLQTDQFLSDIVERLKFVKTKYIRCAHSLSTNKARVETLTQKNATYTKKLKRLSGAAEKMCQALGVHPEKPKEDTASGSGNGDVTENNIAEVLRQLEVRVRSDDALKQRVAFTEELEHLRTEERRWKVDREAFRKAMTMVLGRLAEDGRIIKVALYTIGTDESAKDDVVEDILAAAKKGTETEGDTVCQQQEGVEEQLALLLQKYSRWSKRLQEATEDHLHTQRKIVKYFAAVRRFFTSRDERLPSDEIMDENLIDIDTCLMRFADTILPALDRAIRAAEKNGGGASGLLASSSSMPNESAPSRKDDVLSKLAQQTSRDALLPYDHRLGQIYESVSKLHILFSSLLRVRYLSIPHSARQRSSGDTELIFDDGEKDDGFVDVDLEKLFHASAGAAASSAGAAESTRFSRGDAVSPIPEASAPSSRSTAVNDDLLLRVTAQNLDCLHTAVRKFSSNHKLAAILIQKDTDTMQQLLADMLEKYSELDIEKAFGQDREVLHGLYTTLSERSTRQKGCYFFNRVEGEGSCAWVSALEQLSSGFGQIIEKLVQRTAIAAESRELIDAIVDVCALYVNWVEMTPEVPKDHALSQDIIASCVRDGEGEDKEKSKGAGALPPKPTSPSSAVPLSEHGSKSTRKQVEDNSTRAADNAVVNLEKPKVSYFTKDDVTLKVMQHMFFLAQEAVGAETRARARILAEEGPSAEDLESEIKQLREAVEQAEASVAAASEDRAVLVSERDLAQSEAALAKAELRRWRRLVGELQQQQKQPSAGTIEMSPTKAITAAAQPPQLVSPSVVAAAVLAGNEDANAIDRDCVHELLHYMKALSEELNYAHEVARREEGPRQDSQKKQQQVSISDDGNSEKFFDDHVMANSDSATRREPPRSSNAELVTSPSRQPSLRSSVSKQDHLQNLLREEYDAPLVVIDSASSAARYSAAMGRPGVRGGTAPHSGTRYSPSKHQRSPYVECESCVRHHGRAMPAEIVEAEQSIEEAIARGTSPPRRFSMSQVQPLRQPPPPYRTSPAVRTYRPDEFRTTTVTPVRTTASSRLRADASSATRRRGNSKGRRANDGVLQSERTPLADASAAARRELAERRAAAGAAAALQRRLRRMQGDDYDGEEKYFDDDRCAFPDRSSGLQVNRRMPPVKTSRKRLSSGPSTQSRRESTGSDPITGRARSPNNFNDALRRIDDEASSIVEEDEGSQQQQGRRSSTRRRRTPNTPPEVVADNANLRNAALRRLAEVVSRTKV